MTSGEKIPAKNLHRIWEAGLSRINVPREYGGLSDGTLTFGFTAVAETLTNISAGESSTGQIYGTQALLVRELFNPHNDFPETTRRQLAHEILAENARFVASNAETGASGRVTSRKVDGGIVLNGTKTFNTGSGSARYAAVGHLLEGVAGMHQALVRLDDPAVKQHHDWDNMGQRATDSQTITYEHVFIPDGWHTHVPPFELIFLPFVFTMHGALMLGIGLGGFDAMLKYVQASKRAILPGFKSGVEDPLVRIRVGDLSTRLAAAHALQREIACQVEAFEEGSDAAPLVVHAFRSKAASIEAALTTTSEIYELTGARSTSNTYRLNRFWRSARTFSVHDPTDVKYLAVGSYELTGQLPPLNPAQAGL